MSDMDYEVAHGIAQIENAKLRADNERLRAILQRLVDKIHDYERINNLCPNPGRTECWDEVAEARRALEDGK